MNFDINPVKQGIFQDTKGLAAGGQHRSQDGYRWEDLGLTGWILVGRFRVNRMGTGRKD